MRDGINSLDIGQKEIDSCLLSFGVIYNQVNCCSCHGDFVSSCSESCQGEKVTFLDERTADYIEGTILELHPESSEPSFVYCCGLI
jgi:hypothetical protein